MKTIVAVLAMGTLLAGCGPDPATATKLKELEDRLAKIEEGGGAKAGPRAPGAQKAEPVDREMEQAAAAVLVWRLISYHLYLAAGAPLLLFYSARLLRQRKPPHRFP